mgnify:CR=1 FL=1
MDSIVEFLKRIFSPQITTVLIAILPISELRGAIPVAIGVFKMSVKEAYLLSVLGNLIPVFPILIFLEKVSEWLSKKFVWAKGFFNWLFTRTKTKSKIVERYKAIGLILFVAIPLPVTGAWTGTVAAFLFGIKKRFAFPAITCGVMIAGVIVTLATLGVIKIF